MGSNSISGIYFDDGELRATLMLEALRRSLRRLRPLVDATQEADEAAAVPGPAVRVAEPHA